MRLLINCTRPKVMSKLAVLIGVPMLILSCGTKERPPQEQVEFESKEKSYPRYVKDNTLISEELPKLKLKVDKEFNFVGTFDFEIIANSDEYPEEMQGKPVAAGDRYVFVSANENKDINKLFILQFEGFLPENNFIYNYNFDNAELIGENKYRHNTWFYDSKKLAEENPNNEGAKTRDYLMAKGFQLEDQFMMSRFVGFASEDRKNEVIIFYIEMLKESTGYSLDAYEQMTSKDEADSIKTAFIERSRNSFNIIEG